jgi:hypothetical protein
MTQRVLALTLILATATGAAAATPEEILKASLTAIAAAPRISVRVSILSDEVVASGQKLQRSSEGSVKLRRPDGLRVDVNADKYRRTIQFDGKRLAVFDPDRKFYATFDGTKTVDATVAAVKSKLGLELPLSPLLADNAAAVLGARQRTGVYVGQYVVGGARCHHLAFSQDNVDWQIWISADGAPVPRKIVIDYKNRPGRPQYVAQLSEWDLSARFGNDDFTFTPPADAQKIDFVKQGEKK